MKKSLGIMVAAVGLLLGGQAYALDLNNWNETNLDASTDKVVVTTSYNAGTNQTSVTFTWVDGNFALAAEGMDTVGINTTSALVGCAAGWTCNTPATGSGTMDGFGVFAQTPKDAGGTDLTATFLFAGNASFTANQNGATFAAHVRYGNDCSGFVSDGNTTPGTSSGCGSTSVPEPASLLLLGAGLAGLGIWRRKQA